MADGKTKQLPSVDEFMNQSHQNSQSIDDYLQNGPPQEATAATAENLPGSTERLRAAVNKGVATMQAPTRFEQEHPAVPKNYGFTVGNVARNAYEGAKGLAKGVGEGVYDVALGTGQDPEGNITHGAGGLIGLNEEGEFAPMSRAKALASKYLMKPAEESGGKAAQAFAEGHPVEAAGHGLAAVIPMLGPYAEQLGEQAGRGDIGGAAGSAAGTAIAGELGDLARTKGPAVVDKLARGTPITEAGKLEAAANQAQVVKKPSMTETEYAQRVQDAIPELQKIAQDNPGQIKTPRQAVSAINNRIKQIEEPISQHLQTLNADEDVVHPDRYQREINQAIDQEFAKDPGLHKPAEIEKAKKTVADFMGDQPKSLQEIENNRKRLNQDSDAYYHTDTAGKRAIDVSDATARAQRAAANKIRDILYGNETTPGELEKAGVSAQESNGQPLNLRDVRKRVGNLLELRNHFEDAITKAEATGDWNPFHKLFTGPSIAAGAIPAVAGHAIAPGIGGVIGLLAGEGAKAWGDYLRSTNPNLNVEKMFRNLEQTTPRPSTQIKTMTPVHQYEHAIGPRIPDHMEPIGPQPAPGRFEMGMNPPGRSAMWEQQVGQNPTLTWGGPRAPFNPPIGPKPAVEPMTPPIVGQQARLFQEQPFFDVQHPAGQIPPIPEIGGVGRQGTVAPRQPALKPGETTADRYFNKETEEWAPERQKMHDAIAEKEIAGKVPPTDRPPRAYITAGGTAAGKTTMTREVVGNDPNLVNVDSDKNKLPIPEYEGLKQSDPKKAAARVHDESKAISKNMITHAVKNGLDFIYDTSTGGGGDKLFKKLKDLGYDVHVLYADVPTDVAVERADKRARESTDPINRNRFVPEGVIRKKHAEAAQAFHQFTESPHIDSIRAFDTSKPKPVEFYQRTGGPGSGKVLNQEAFDRTKEKAREVGTTEAKK
jgi:hypothetical protein